MLTTKRELIRVLYYFSVLIVEFPRASIVHGSEQAQRPSSLPACVSGRVIFCHLVNVFARTRTDNVERARTKPRHGWMREFANAKKQRCGSVRNTEELRVPVLRLGPPPMNGLVVPISCGRLARKQEPRKCERMVGSRSSP